MGHSKSTAFARGGWLRERAAGALRPSIEAMLLAAVALGCAQAGWTLLTPSAAGAASTTDTSDNEGATFEVAEVQSPFAPDAGSLGAESHAVAALLSSVQLNGIRMSTDPARSGAMFTLGDGVQRAFVVGQQIADGVTLAEIEAGYVLLAYEGGERRLEMSAGPGFSFARAMMGLEPATGAPSIVAATEAGSPAPQLASEASSLRSLQLSTSDRAWLSATLSNIDIENGRTRGWRLADHVPAAAGDAGLRSGDLVVSINGAGPGDIPAALAAARAGVVELEIERDGTHRTLTLDIDERS